MADTTSSLRICLVSLSCQKHSTGKWSISRGNTKLNQNTDSSYRSGTDAHALTSSKGVSQIVVHVINY